MTDQTITNVREGRHLAKIALVKALQALEGRPGLSKDEQAQALNAASDLASEAVSAINKTYSLAVERDFEAHQQEKGESGPPPVTHLYFDAAIEEEQAEA